MSITHKDISVCALIPYPPNTAPSQRFRLEQWMPFLNEQGIAVTHLPFVDEGLMRILYQPGALTLKTLHLTKAFSRRFWDIIQSQRYDAVLIHRAVCIAGPAWLERLARLFNRPIIYDFDDAIFKLNMSEANSKYGWFKFPGKTADICRISSHIVVGNSYLADYAQQFNANISIIPSSVDIDQYQMTKRSGASDRHVTIGWTGSSTSQTHLESFAPLLRELLHQREVELHVISDRKPELPGVPVTWHRWSPETEISDLARFDIGIMPMPDDEWSRGKCSMKALLYMAMAIPTICSAVGMNQEVIQHGENGFLASTNEEWLGCLTALIDDVALRQRLGAAGRQTIEAQYSMRHCAEKFANVIRETVAHHQAQQEVGRWYLKKSKSNVQ
jgi:glycosyltransferase involved in cell wall biosynthesis